MKNFQQTKLFSIQDGHPTHNRQVYNKKTSTLEAGSSKDPSKHPGFHLLKDSNNADGDQGSQETSSKTGYYLPAQVLGLFLAGKPRLQDFHRPDDMNNRKLYL